jgi:flagellar protein FliS
LFDGPSPLKDHLLSQSRKAFEYRKQAVYNASPVGLVVMLYDGALQFMEAGKRAMQMQDLQGQSSNLQRAQKIVTHLMSTLDMEKGGKVSENLMPLYQYVYRRLVDANVYDKVELIDESIAVFSELREGWSALDEQVTSTQQRELLAA